MIKHTPGPWAFYNDNRIEIVAIGKTIARIYHSVPSEDLPNARLIAAAPDLLDALEMIAYSNNSEWQADCAKQAIAKAKGEV